MLRVKAYNNGNKTMLYSVETYRLGPDRYFAVTSDQIKRVVELRDSYNEIVGETVSMVRPLSEGDTRQEAIENLQKGVSVMVGVEPKNQSFIAIRHHDVWACYYCGRFPKFEKHDDWKQHNRDSHSQPISHGMPEDNMIKASP